MKMTSIVALALAAWGGSALADTSQPLGGSPGGGPDWATAVAQASCGKREALWKGRCIEREKGPESAARRSTGTPRGYGGAYTGEVPGPGDYGGGYPSNNQ